VKKPNRRPWKAAIVGPPESKPVETAKKTSPAG
jgi:hypothetical protein